jgi:hypothetical protein
MQISSSILLALIAASPVVAQWTCGGTQYEPGSVTFSPQCEALVTNCVEEFANVTLGGCEDPAGLVNMQQQPNSGNNSDLSTAFTDIVNECINNGFTTATWFRDSQWYWMATGSECYNFTLPNIPSDLSTPVQQRISIQGKNSEFAYLKTYYQSILTGRCKAIAVGWNTYTELSSSCVQYGLSAQDLQWQECTNSSVTYPTSRTWSNVVSLGNLQSGTTYFYKIVSTNSTVGQFLSPRDAGDDTPFALAVVIDMGVYGIDGLAPPDSNSKKDSIPNIQPELNHTTIWQLAQSVNDYEFVVHPGDFAYADNFAQVFSLDSNPTEAYQTILEQFWEQLSPVASNKPYMVGPGNHDADCTESNFNAETSCPIGQFNFTDFTYRFEQMMPTTFATESTQESAQSLSEEARMLAKAPFWYSFDYGMVHITMIDTETDFANSPDGPGGSSDLDAGPFGFTNQQLEFVAADLASVDRTITPWVIVAGHRAWYSTGGSGNICSPCQIAFEELLYTYGVDLAMFGHVHNSQRFMPVFNGTADPNGMNDPKAPMYIVAGGAGNIEGLAAVGSNLSFNAFAYGDDFSFATLNFLDRNHLQVDFIQSSTGDVLDSSVLFKSHDQQFVVQGTTTSTSSSTSAASSTTGSSTSASTSTSTSTSSSSSSSSSSSIVSSTTSVSTASIPTSSSTSTSSSSSSSSSSSNSAASTSTR